MADSTSASVRAPDRSTPAPPPPEWKWLSASPGTTVRPPRSITRVAAVSCARTSASVPTARIRPSAMATARARGCASSTVMTLPLTRIVSAGRGAWDHDARPTAARQHVKHRNKVDMLICPLLDTLRPSVSSSLHQWGVCPGMITTSPLVMRLDTPPSIPEPRTLVIRSIAGTTRRMWGSPSLHPTSDTGMYHRNACIGHAPAKGPRAFAVGWMQFSPTRDMTAHAPCSPSTSRCWRGRSCSSAHRSPTRNAMRCWRRSSAAARGCACTTCGDRICPMRPTIIWSN